MVDKNGWNRKQFMAYTLIHKAFLISKRAKIKKKQRVYRAAGLPPVQKNQLILLGHGQSIQISASVTARVAFPAAAALALAPSDSLPHLSTNLLA